MTGPLLRVVGSVWMPDAEVHLADFHRPCCRHEFLRGLVGISELRDFKFHLHVDPNVPPATALKLGRVSFALHGKVYHRASRRPYYVRESCCCSTQAYRRNKTLRGRASR